MEKATPPQTKLLVAMVSTMIRLSAIHTRLTDPKEWGMVLHGTMANLDEIGVLVKVEIGPETNPTRRARKWNPGEIGNPQAIRVLDVKLGLNVDVEASVAGEVTPTIHLLEHLMPTPLLCHRMDLNRAGLPPTAKTGQCSPHNHSNRPKQPSPQTTRAQIHAHNQFPWA